MQRGKKFTTRKGEMLWMTRHYSDKMEYIKVISLSQSGLLTYLDKDGRVRQDYLQDMGMPGWKYDNRPIQLHRKCGTAYRVHARARKWFKVFKTRYCHDEYCDGYDE